MIKPLTSLRFFFALMVFFSHLDYLTGSESEMLKWAYQNIFNEGYIGVSFFFILSGFILAYNYQDSILQGRKSKKTFYIARFARIYPLHVLTFLVSIPLTWRVFWSDKTMWFLQAMNNLTLTQAFIPAKEFFYSFNSPSWSISDEMFFYLVFPFIIMAISRLTKYKKIVVPLVIAIIPLLALIIPNSLHHKLFYINPVFRLFDFSIGIILYNIYKGFINKEIRANFNLLEFFALGLLIGFFAFHDWMPRVSRYSFYYWIPMSFLIFIFSFQKGLISRLLSNKIFLHLGEISFGFYMFHQLVLRYFYAVNNRTGIFENDYLMMFGIFAVALVISHFSFVWFETPVNRRIKNVFRKPEGVTSVAVKE